MLMCYLRPAYLPIDFRDLKIKRAQRQALISVSYEKPGFLFD